MGQHFIPVHVIPGSRKFEIVGWDPWRRSVKIKVRSRPEEGRANVELINELNRLLNCEIMIKSGHASRDKLLVVTCDEKWFDEVKKRLRMP